MILEKDGHIAVLTLNRRDKMNAISAEMRENLPLTLQEVQGDDNLRALIITGAGRGFCSGADVTGIPLFMNTRKSAQAIQALIQYSELQNKSQTR